MMAGLGALELAALREGLGRANPGFTARELDEAVGAILRQHEDPEEHDRSLIAERLRWSPDERLRALQSFLTFVDEARASRVP
jgi:hypothetical protein